MIKTTLNKIKEREPCSDGWKKLLKHLKKTGPDDEPLSFLEILKSNGIDDAVWCLCVLPYKQRCLFQRDMAYLVLHIFERKHPKDNKPRKALEAISDWSKEVITDRELNDFAKNIKTDYAAYVAYVACVACVAARRLEKSACAVIRDRV